MPAYIKEIKPCKGYCYEKPYMIVTFYPMKKNEVFKSTTYDVSYDISMVNRKKYIEIGALDRETREERMKHYFEYSESEFIKDHCCDVNPNVCENFNSYLIPFWDISEHYKVYDVRRQKTLVRYLIITQEDYENAKKVARRKVIRDLAKGYLKDADQDSIVEYFYYKYKDFKVSDEMIPVCKFKHHDTCADEFITAVLYYNIDSELRIGNKTEKYARLFIVAAAIRYKTKIAEVKEEEWDNIFDEIVKTAFFTNWQKEPIAMTYFHKEKYFEWFKYVMQNDVDEYIDEYYKDLYEEQNEDEEEWHNWSEDTDAALEGNSLLELGLD